MFSKAPTERASKGSVSIINSHERLPREFTIGTSNSKTEGFAPIEQYERHGHFTTATDVYALAATLYFLLTAKVPIPANYRKNDNSKNRRLWFSKSI